MSFEVDRYSSAWAHIALCADVTWATESADDFIVANQRLWAQYCRVSQILQETTLETQSLQVNQSETDGKRAVPCQVQENCNSGGRSVKDVIPESRLAQYYGNFYYDELREKCYTNTNERSLSRGFSGQSCENSDLTECWMLPEVDYWFRKLLDDSDRNMLPRRRRQYRTLPDDDFERWSPNGARAVGAEAVLAARVHSVKSLWAPTSVHPSLSIPRAPSPPQVSRKMRARRRQPRRFTALAPPPPAYCLEVPAQLFCDPSCKFQFESPRPPQLMDCQRGMSRISMTMQAAMRASVVRCPPYRGTNVSRYAPTGQRPARYPDRRYGISWPRDHLCPRLNHRLQLSHIQHGTHSKTFSRPEQEESKTAEITEKTENEEQNEQNKSDTHVEETTEPETSESHKEEDVEDNQMPSTSTAPADTGLRKKRLYSTVLSMSAPTSINLSPVVRLAQKLVTPGILKLNPKIVLPSARVRLPNVENKFEELEKEALEQYKASDESIDTKFSELEKQAVEQYSTSNSNTSCSSGNSASKKPSEDDVKNKQSTNSHKEKPVDSVVIYSQNFPDLSSKGTSVMNLKNFQTPPRGEKKDHRSKGSRLKNEAHRAASDTDNEVRESNFKNHKGPLRWTLHVIPPKKRHLTLCVSDFSSDEDLEDGGGSIKDAGPRIKNHNGKMKMSAHGGGDLHPIMRKT